MVGNSKILYLARLSKRAIFTSTYMRKLISLALSMVFGLGVLAQECNVIYVTPNGASSGAAGTKANPASLLYGLSLVSSTNKKVYLSKGTYNISNPLYLPSNVEMEGGFDATNNWAKSNSYTSKIYRDNLNPDPNPERLVAVYCLAITGFRLQDLTIQTSGAFINGASTYGVYLTGCSNYQFVRCKIISGNAANGNNGNNGLTGLSGAPGTPGEGGDANEDEDAPRAGGPGGAGSFPGSNAGGEGGDGAERGTWEFPADGEAFPGYDGNPGLGACPGYAGNAGSPISGVFNITALLGQCFATENNAGSNGGQGCNGIQGMDGLPGQYLFAGGFFVPGSGSNGVAGTNGAGGGGGGGGGGIGNVPYDPIFGLIPNKNGCGNGGGGGGEGGQGGIGGDGGQGGGGSFAVYLDGNGASGSFKDCVFTPGNPGLGGLGGNGGIGGNGGNGGAGGNYQLSCNAGYGGNGGEGGQGGNGGKGGKGSDGLSYDLYLSPGSTEPTLMNINSLQQPAAVVESKGCTNSPVTLSSTTAGTIEWYFGNGTTPLYTVGQNVTVSFGTTGRKTFTMIVNGAAYTFTEFIDIYNNQATNVINPTINSGDSILCAGSSGTYTSSISGTAYYWELFDENNTLIDTFPSNPGQTNTISFPYSGNFLLTLVTESACCGKSFPDSFNIRVDTILPVGIVISSSEQDNGDTVCQGAFITFSAAAENAGPNPQYQWRVNGASAGTGPTFSSATLASGSIIDCVVTSSEFCSLGQTAASNQITATIISAPVVSCIADSLVANEPTYFFAEVTSGGVAPFEYNWDFGDNFTGYGDSVQHMYTDKGSYSVNVVVTDINGCVGACSTVVTILQELAANFSADKLQGCAPFAVAFTNLSTNAVNYLWDFGDGETSVITNPVHVYQASGTYTVTLDAFGGTGSLTQQVNNQVSVLPAPTAQAQAYPNEITETGDTVFFADNSFNAWSWYWDFGDGTTSTEQNPIHVYQDNGCYNVYLAVTNEYGCSDTLFMDNFVCKTVGMEEISGIKGVFPNPFNNKIEINFSSIPAQLKLELSDLTGKNIETIAVTKTLNQVLLETPSLAEGTYLLKVASEKGIWVKKLVHLNETK